MEVVLLEEIRDTAIKLLRIACGERTESTAIETDRRYLVLASKIEQARRLPSVIGKLVVARDSCKLAPILFANSDSLRQEWDCFLAITHNICLGAACVTKKSQKYLNRCKAELTFIEAGLCEEIERLIDKLPSAAGINQEGESGSCPADSVAYHSDSFDVIVVDGNSYPLNASEISIIRKLWLRAAMGICDARTSDLEVEIVDESGKECNVWATFRNTNRNRKLVQKTGVGRVGLSFVEKIPRKSRRASKAQR